MVAKWAESVVTSVNQGPNVRVHCSSLNNNITLAAKRLGGLGIRALAIDNIERSRWRQDRQNSFQYNHIIGRRRTMLLN